MNKSQWNITNYAQRCLATISPEAPADVALSVMRKLGVHYMPVQKGDRVVGLLSDQRLRAAFAWGFGSGFLVSDLMLKRPTIVSPEASLFQVLDETPESTAGCTIVQNKAGEVTGLFTPKDAVLAFHHLLSGNPKESREVAA